MTTYVRLQGVPHPDLNEGKSSPVFINADRVVSIERGSVSFAKVESQERMREAYVNVAQTLDKVYEEVKGMDLDSVLGQPAKFAAFTEAVNAYGKAVQSSPAVQPEHHPRVECTIVRYGYGAREMNGFEWGSCFVLDLPEQIADRIAKATVGSIF